MLDRDAKLNTEKEMEYTDERAMRLLEWVLRGNEDGLPNEARGCYTTTDWKNVALLVKHDEIPTDSSHVYQCQECCDILERMVE